MASTATGLRRLATTARPSTNGSSAAGTTSSTLSPVKWLGTTPESLSNQKLEMAVRILPFSGIGCSRITSNAERRSVATISMRLASIS
ncbi:hypothetical protein D3C76_1290710 [compost metagenome]